jgi:hypothetical protein
VPGIVYPLQLVLTQPIADIERLRRLFFEMAGEAGIADVTANVTFTVEDTAPNRAFAPSGGLSANHYVGEAQGAPANFELRPHWVRMLGLRLWNGKPNEPTVLHVFVSAAMWDGTSCFNFLKELVARYCGEPPTNVIGGGKELQLSDDAAQQLLANTSFALFLLRMPVVLALNLGSWLWHQLEADWAGPGLAMRVVCLNLDEKESQRLADGMKRRGAKPYAAFSYAAVQAYAHVFRRAPAAIAMQASLVTHGYVPHQPARSSVGDWLIGPLQPIPRDAGAYTLSRAQEGYEELLAALDKKCGSVARAFEARAYGFVNGGAARCEFTTGYNDSNQLLNSVFLNNYGIRELNRKINFYSYNWAAPFGLGFNVINVNGRTCIGVASSTMSLAELEEARDHALGTLRSFMATS